MLSDKKLCLTKIFPKFQEMLGNPLLSFIKPCNNIFEFYVCFLLKYEGEIGTTF